MHTMTVAISSILREGKKTIYNTGTSEYRPLLVTSETTDNLKRFTLRCCYNDKKSNSHNEARVQKRKTMKRKSTFRIQPESESHDLRGERVNYQTYVGLHFQNRQTHPCPSHHC